MTLERRYKGKVEYKNGIGAYKIRLERQNNENIMYKWTLERRDKEK